MVDGTATCTTELKNYSPGLKDLIDEGQHQFVHHSEVDDPGLPLVGRGPSQLAVVVGEVFLVALRDLLVEVAAVVGHQHGPEQVELLAAHVAGVAEVLDLLHPLTHRGLNPRHMV